VVFFFGGGTLVFSGWGGDADLFSEKSGAGRYFLRKPGKFCFRALHSHFYFWGSAIKQNPDKFFERGARAGRIIKPLKFFPWLKAPTPFFFLGGRGPHFLFLFLQKGVAFFLRVQVNVGCVGYLFLLIFSRFLPCLGLVFSFFVSMLTPVGGWGEWLFFGGGAWGGLCSGFFLTKMASGFVKGPTFTGVFKGGGGVGPFAGGGLAVFNWGDQFFLDLASWAFFPSVRWFLFKKTAVRGPGWAR